jgi:hypothetical protein
MENYDCRFLYSFNGIDAGRIIRLNSDGLRDATLMGSGFTSSIVYATAQQADGKIIVVGSFTKYNTTTQTEWFDF